jgi:hypothetical protein
MKNLGSCGEGYHWSVFIGHFPVIIFHFASQDYSKDKAAAQMENEK